MENEDNTNGGERIDNNSLEGIVSNPEDEIKQNPESLQSASENQITPNLFPLESYIKSFTRRYNLEESFRNKVHNYLNLSRGQRVVLGLSSLFLPSYHRKKTGTFITQYATLVYEDLKKALEVEKEIAELDKKEVELKRKEELFSSVRVNYEEKQNEHGRLESEKEKKKSDLQQELAYKVEEETKKLDNQEETIKQLSDPEYLVKEKLKEQILGMPLVSKDKDGNLRFEDKRMAEKLEEMFLDEVLSDIEKEEKPGFFFRLKRKYDGLITHHDLIEDLSELPHVDWLQSTILSRTQGYRIPVFPYLVTGKSDEKQKVRVAQSIDQAIALDVSSSMEKNQRFEIAQKATLATHALMRKLNPKNNTYLGVFNSDLREVTTAQLMREIKPYNGTHTEEAIKWIIRKLKDSPLAIAYLITDGEPNHIDQTIEEAKKLRDYKNILFRIFLIDGEKNTEEITRRVGLAAGPSTRVLPIKNYQLPNGLIKDIDNALGQMYSITDF